MSAAKEKEAPPEDAAGEAPQPAPGGRRKLVLIAAPVVVLLLGAGAWMSGLPQHLLGGGKHAQEAGKNGPPVFVDLPEMVANLDSDPRRPRYVKLRARIEIAHESDTPAVNAAMPRLQDLFQTYLRDMRPEELRGSAGTYRLREELLSRANV